MINVTDLRSALVAYWAANNHREQQAAYHEVLLFGGYGGYEAGWRSHKAMRSASCQPKTHASLLQNCHRSQKPFFFPKKTVDVLFKLVA